MKKTIVCALIASALTVSPVFASEVNLADMTLDELVALRSSITEEIEARTAVEEANSEDAASKDMIPAGIYTVGQNIKEGMFKLSTDDNNYMKVYVFANDNDSKLCMDAILLQSDTEDIPAPLFYVYLSRNSSCMVNLEEENVLYLDENEAFIEEVKASWMPD